MKNLDHKNIIKILEIIETKKECCIVLEYASGGEVLDYIVARGRLREIEARKFFVQIVAALVHFRSSNVYLNIIFLGVHSQSIDSTSRFKGRKFSS